MYRSLSITSAQNPKLKHILALRDKRAREKHQQFLIEGFREITRALQMGYPLQAVFFCQELFLGSNEDQLLMRAAEQVPLYELPAHLFEKYSYRDRPDGLLAIAPMSRISKQDFIASCKKRAQGSPYFLVVAESIEKPGNLGSILRSCDAAGVHGILVCDRQADVYNPNVVRASIGTLFTVPLWECSLHEMLSFLQEEKIELVAATPHAKQEFTKADLRSSLAVAMGSEQLGLSKELMAQATIQVKIPMFGIADSLNVAAATTLMLYEVVRQRRSV